MRRDLKPLERVQIAPGAVPPEQRLAETIDSRLPIAAAGPGDRQRLGAPLQVRREHDRRQPAAVVDMKVGEQHQLQFGGADPGLAHAFKRATARVDEDPPAVVGGEDEGRRGAPWVDERATAAQDEELGHLGSR